MEDKKIDKAELLKELFYDKKKKCIDLSYLVFKCDVDIHGMYVEGNLIQDSQRVTGDLFQGGQNVGGDLMQDSCYVEGSIYQNKHYANFSCVQNGQTVGVALLQDKPIIKTQLSVTSTNDDRDDLAKSLYDQCYKAHFNTIDLRNLDFTAYKCNVDTSHMKVDGDLLQNHQEVTGKLQEGKE